MKKTITTILVALMLSSGMLNEAKASTNPYLGEIMAVGFNFCPRGWAKAEGQLLPIASHTALFSLLGTTYGGDGRVTFGLPDLRNRSAVGVGNGPGLGDVIWGQKGGSLNFTLTTAQIPAHGHNFAYAVTVANGRGTTTEAAGNYIAESAIFRPGTSQGTSATNSGGRGVTADAGGSQAVQKRSPFLGMYHCIATQGTFPSRS